jgi:hypothetical protein
VKVHQQPKFQSIILVLETKEEAEWLWEAVDSSGLEVSQQQREFYTALSNWFLDSAQLGGTPPTEESKT